MPSKKYTRYPAVAEIDWETRRKLVDSIDWDKLRDSNERRRQARPMRIRLEEIIRDKPQLEYCDDEVKDLEEMLAYVIKLEESNARLFNKMDELRSELYEARAKLKNTASKLAILAMEIERFVNEADDAE